MANIPRVQPGFFLARRPFKGGKWLYATFLKRDKAYYIESGWAEVNPDVAQEAEKPIEPPVVNRPTSLDLALRAPKPQRGRPAKKTEI